MVEVATPSRSAAAAAAVVVEVTRIHLHIPSVEPGIEECTPSVAVGASVVDDIAGASQVVRLDLLCQLLGRE